MTKVGKVTNIKIEKVSLVTEGANSAAHIKFFKNKKEEETKMNMEEILKSMSAEQAEVVKSEIEKAKCKAKEEMEKEKEEKAKDGKKNDMEDAPKEKEKEDNFAKGMPEAVKVELEKAKHEVEAMKVVLAKMKEEKEEKELETEIAKYRTCGIEESSLKTLLKKSKADKELNDIVVSMLEQMSKVTEDSALFKAKGTEVQNKDGISALDQLNNKATEISKAKSISFAKAFTEAINANPELYTKYTEEI